MNIDINNVDMVDIVDDVDHIVAVRIPRQIYVRFDCFNYYSDEEFFKRFRLTKPTILYLLERIEENLEYIVAEKNNSISPMDQLLITLRVYATGGHLVTIGDYIRCDKSTVSRIVAKVTSVIASLGRQHIHMPRNPAEIAKRQNDFYEVAGFPKVIGAIDGSHIKINSQGGPDAEIFRNRKGYFSINIQAVASADLLFQDIVARWPGSAHDSTIFNNSRLKYRLENGEFGNSFLLGFCLKTKEVGTDTKVFINVCQTDGIPVPADITEAELIEMLDSENPPFRVPMSICEIQQSTDNKGEVVKVSDVAIHPEFFKKIQKIEAFKRFFISIIFEALNDKYGIICVDEKIILKNRKVFGTLQSHRIQQRDVQQKMGSGNVLLSDGNENRSGKPLIETISSNESAVRIKEPEYRLFRRRTQPNCLIGEFKFPDVISAKQLVVDVGEDRIVIESPSRNYLLDIFIPHLIRQNSCSSTFNKSTKILTLTMPLIGG